MHPLKLLTVMTDSHQTREIASKDLGRCELSDMTPGAVVESERGADVCPSRSAKLFSTKLRLTEARIIK